MPLLTVANSPDRDAALARERLTQSEVDLEQVDRLQRGRLVAHLAGRVGDVDRGHQLSRALQRECGFMILVNANSQRKEPADPMRSAAFAGINVCDSSARSSLSERRPMEPAEDPEWMPARPPYTTFLAIGVTVKYSSRAVSMGTGSGVPLGGRRR